MQDDGPYSPFECEADMHFYGYCSRPIHQNSYVDVATLKVELREGAPDTAVVDRMHWKLHAEFGPWPADGTLLTTELFGLSWDAWQEWRASVVDPGTGPPLLEG